MELMQLEMFIAVVEKRSVRKAAEEVCRTQPAVSMALRKLEEEIDARLFERSQRFDYTLTPVGDVVYQYAKRVMDLRKEACVEINNLRSLRSGRLRIGANESINFYLLPRWTQVFHEKYPKIKLEVTCHNADRLVRHLSSRSIDLALLAHTPGKGDFEKRLISRDPLVLIVSPQHRLSCAKTVSFKDLAPEPFIVEGNYSSSYDKIVGAFRRKGVDINIHIESATIETIKRMVGMNIGVGIVPLMCLREELDQGKLVRVGVDGFREERSLWAVRRSSESHSQASEAFMEVIRNVSERPRAKSC
jgi:DNA-binding transcriptional LysR family regulator